MVEKRISRGNCSLEIRDDGTFTPTIFFYTFLRILNFCFNTMQLFFIPEISEKVFFLLSIFNFVAINLTIYWKFLFFKKNHFSNYSIFAIFSNLLETNWRRNWNFWESHIHAHTHTWETRLPFQSFFWVGSELTRSRGWKREFTFNSGRSRDRYAMTDCIPDDKFEATPFGGGVGLRGWPVPSV